MKYRISTGSLTVQARSRVHNTTAVWNLVTGVVEADPATLATAGATAKFEVDMTAFDAGDFLKNRKLRSDFELARYPTATFELTSVRDVAGSGGAFTARATGVLAWHGRQVELVLAGRGTLDAMTVSASAQGALDIRTLGLAAPRFLMFKVEDEVTVAVEIRGAAAP